MKYVLDKCCRDNKNTYFVISNFFRKSYRVCDTVEKVL